MYSNGHPLALAFYPPSHDSGGQPSVDGIRELAASRWHSPMITHRLVVSYTTFSPLPCRSGAVLFFCFLLLLPIASTFGSGASCAARTFLSHPAGCQRQNRDTVFRLCKVTAIYPNRKISSLLFQSCHQLVGYLFLAFHCGMARLLVYARQLDEFHPIVLADGFCRLVDGRF